MQPRERLEALRQRFRTEPADRTLKLMEICGTHTMSIARAGLKKLLPPQVRLLSGPGCPVCVTPAGQLDLMLELSSRPDLVLTCYGDLMRVPGSRRGDSLAARRARGADIRMVYSPMDALDMAAGEPHKNFIFLGVGFETTAPGTGITILEAAERRLTNFSVYSMLKYTEPAIRALLADPDCRIDGLLCPGHVASILGAEAFSFLPEEYGLPAVVGGFEQEDVVEAVCRLAELSADGRAKLQNAYPRAVRPQGNPAALAVMRQVFAPVSSSWRGLGEIPVSGMAIREAFAPYDAGVRYASDLKEIRKKAAASSGNACRCGEILKGKLEPEGCPLFGSVCCPSDPVGPCMVSGEGACAAAYKYRYL